MATYVGRDVSVVVNSVDLSNHVQSCTVDESMETQDATAMGNSARAFAGGLFADTIDITFLQDFASGSVDATIAAVFRNRTSHTVVVKPTSSAVSTTNPTYTLTGLVSSYNPISGSVGDMATCDVSWVNTTTAGLARATS